VPLCRAKFSSTSTEANFQTGQTGGQPFSDTSLSVFPGQTALKK